MSERNENRGVTRRQVLVGLGGAVAGALVAPSITRAAAPTVLRAKSKLVYSNYEQKQTGVIAGLSNYWDLVKEAFEKKYPDIEVVQVSVPSSEYWNKLFTEITTGNAADVYKDRLSEAVQFSRMGLLSPLDDLCNVKEINATFEDIQKTQIVDGKTYGVAYQGGSHQLVYNKTLLAKGGFQVPTTPEEAYETAKKLTKPGEQWGFVVVTPSVPQLYIDLTQWVVGYNSHWGDKGKVTATADATVASMEMYRKIVAEGITPVGVPKPQTREMFVAGKIAMMIEGPWFFADPKITPERLAFMGTATLPWPNKRSVSSASTFIVPKAAKNKEAAGKFIDFCSSLEWQIKFLEVAMLPGNRKGAFPKSFTDKFPFMAAYAEGAPKAVDSCPPGFEDVFKQLQKSVIDAAGEFLFKNVPVRKALETVQAQMEKELETAKKKA